MNLSRFFKRFFMVLFMIVVFQMNLQGQVRYPADGTEGYDKETKEWLRKIDEFKKTLKPPLGSIPLTFKCSFPGNYFEDNEIFLNNGRSLALDKNNHLYVADAGYDRILKFDLQGKFLAQLGRNGQGPGDLYRPYNILVFNDHLVIYENGNRRIQYTDLKGNYIRSFKVFKNYCDIAVDREGNIYVTPVYIRHPKKEKVIDKLNAQGRLIHSFGNTCVNHPSYNRARIALSREGKIFLGFRRFPIVRKYSPSGELLREYKINHPYMAYAEKWNREFVKNKKVNSPSYGRAMNMFQGFKLANDHIYILTYLNPYFEILEFDLDCKQENVYCWSVPENRKGNYGSIDFLVHKKEGKKLFYIIVHGGPKEGGEILSECKVYVFEAKNK